MDNKQARTMSADEYKNIKDTLGIAEYASLVGISPKSAYARIEKQKYKIYRADLDNLKLVKKDILKLDFQIEEDEAQDAAIDEEVDPPQTDAEEHPSTDSTDFQALYIQSLLDRLEEKDKQIAEYSKQLEVKDEQIGMLNRSLDAINIALQKQQALTLTDKLTASSPADDAVVDAEQDITKQDPTKKKGFLARLFGK